MKRPTRRMTMLVTCTILFSLVVALVHAYPHYYGNYSRFNHGYYGPWRNREHGYYKLSYYYRQNSWDTQYHYHYCYYYPTDRYGNNGYYYYYNPGTGRFWGRCHAGYNANYEMLYGNDRQPSLTMIDNSAFKQLQGMPQVPGMSPPTTMIGPPPLEPPDLVRAY